LQTFAQGEAVNLDIYVYDYPGGTLTDVDGYPPTPPTVAVYDKWGTKVNEGLAERLSVGIYQYTYLLSTTAAKGVWKYVWSFAVGGVGLPEADRTEEFKVEDASCVTLLEIRADLRLKLKDNHPDYTKRKFTDLELQSYIQNALWDINATPPSFTYFTIGDWEANVPEWKGLIVQGAMIFALIAQGVFEIGKEFSYSDNGISITIDRSSKYQSMANLLLTRYDKMKENVKKAYFMRVTIPRVIVSGQLDRKIRTYAPSQWRIR
jgi:hypothetical protein